MDDVSSWIAFVAKLFCVSVGAILFWLAVAEVGGWLLEGFGAH